WLRVSRLSHEGIVNPVTHGAFDAIRFGGVGEQSGYLYFIALPENPTHRYLYRARLDGSGEADRVTPRDAAGTHAYHISPNGHWVVHTFIRMDVPPKTDLVRLPDH